MRRVTVKRGLGFLVIFVLLAAGWVVAQQAPQAAVTIYGFTFKPGELTVAPGTEVTWTNKDGPAHTVSATDRSFDSGAVSTDKTFKRKFEKAGTFNYGCQFHPTMTGKVAVK